MAQTVVNVEILDDGTLKMTTGAVGAEVHQNLEGAIKWMASKMGGKQKRERRGDVAHTHSHSHGSQTHSH